MGKLYPYSTKWEKKLCKLFIFMEPEVFFYYFNMTKTLKMSNGQEIKMSAFQVIFTHKNISRDL